MRFRVFKSADLSCFGVPGTLVLFAVALAGCGELEPAGRGMMPLPGSGSGEHPQKAEGAGQAVPGWWVAVEPGAFLMGSPSGERCRDGDEDRHRVTLTTGFVMGRSEVTQLQFRSAMGYNPAFHGGCDDCPVEWVTWYEAAAYCNRLSENERRPRCYTCSGRGPEAQCVPRAGPPQRCRGYRLPTEAEWEYSARAGAETPLCVGPLSCCMATDVNAGRIAWYKVNSGGRSHPVGRKKANNWGLFDLAGGVYEWVHDWYRPNLGTAPARDPYGPPSGTERVLRGGAWYYNAEHLRSANRERFAPGKRFTFVGFRCVRSR